MKGDVVYLGHIVEAISKIEKYLGKQTLEEFLASDITQDAVVRQFEIIGEASRNVSERFKDKHPGVAWYKATAMRNIIIHEYFYVNLEMVYDTARKDLPDLKMKVQAIISELK